MLKLYFKNLDILNSLLKIILKTWSNNSLLKYYSPRNVFYKIKPILFLAQDSMKPAKSCYFLSCSQKQIMKSSKMSTAMW